MTDAWRYAEIEGFEHVSLGGKTGLLRLSGVPSPKVGHAGARPMLVADDGDAVSRFNAIPAPPDVDGQLRAAYSVPSSLVSPDTVFCLEFDDGYVVSLPEPVAGPARVNRRREPDAGAPAAPDEPAPATLAEASPAVPEIPEGEDRRRDMPRQVAALSAQLADARRENAELRYTARQTIDEAQQLREALLHQHVVLAEQDAELTALRDLSAASSAPAGAAEGTAETSELQRALSQAESERDAALAAQDEAESGTDVGALRKERNEAVQELEQLREEVKMMSLDREELDRQASAFDGVATKARERATDAEAELEQSRGRLSELETWSAELERRLADTTTELADAKAETEANDSELRRLRGELAEARAQSELDQAALGRSRGGWPAESSLPSPSAQPSSPLPSSAPSPEEIAEAAVRDAHEQAERDLADAS